MKQTFIVGNVAGAAGTIGMLRAVRAPANAHTLLLFAVSSPLNLMPLVQPFPEDARNKVYSVTSRQRWPVLPNTLALVAGIELE